VPGGVTLFSPPPDFRPVALGALGGGVRHVARPIASQPQVAGSSVLIISRHS